MSQRFLSQLRSRSRFLVYGLIIALSVGVFGATRVFFGHAAVSTASVEAEAGTLTTPTKVVTDTSASGGQAVQFATSATASLPAAPSGYKLWDEWDFRNMGTTLPAGWTAQSSSGGNSAGTYRPQNVAVVPGVGLVHTAERASVGATIYTGKVYGRVGVPQFVHVRFKAYATGFKQGVWPSFWARPQSGGAMEGEKDFIEMFGGHIDGSSPRVVGGGYITTPYDSGHQGNSTIEYDPVVGQTTSSNTWNQPHVYDFRQVQGVGANAWIDDTAISNAITKARMSNQVGKDNWDSQFEDPNATWYFRTDFQISGTGSQAGVTNAGLLTDDQVGQFAKWTIEWVQVFVPN